MNNSGRSQFPTIKLDQLVYVELEAGNGGMMLTVSEDGFTFRAVTPIGPSRKIHFSFVVNAPEKLEGYGNIDWTQDGGKVASLQFSDVSSEFQTGLRKWLAQLSAPAVPSFTDAHFRNSDFGVEQPAAPASAGAVESTVEPVIEAGRMRPPSEFATPASTLFAPLSLNNRVTPLDSFGPTGTPGTPLSGTVPVFSDWQSPVKLPTPSGHRIRGVAAAAILIAVVALAVILYGYHEAVGQLLISLGQRMSAPKEASDVPPVKVPAVPTPPVVSPEPASAVTPESRPIAAGTVLANENQQRSQTSSVTAKPGSTFRDDSATQATAAELQNQDPAERARSLWAAVAQGNTSAEVTLAKLYLIGGGVTKNCDQARVLLQAAAKKGNGEAIDKLSQIRQQGCP